MMLSCERLLELVNAGVTCEVTDAGLRMPTHCLYPSAEPVYVHVAAFGDGFQVSDAGGISRNVFVHGKDESALIAGLSAACNRHGLRTAEGALFADVPSADWLPAAIAAVANGACLAATVALDHASKKAENRLIEKIHERLSMVVPERYIARAFEFRGKSGKAWKIDFAVLETPASPVLYKAVTPHHTSVSSNYTAFGDIGNQVPERFAVYQNKIGPEDSSLLLQVATLVPVWSVDKGTKAALGRLH